MLVLSRKVGERIIIGDNITVVVSKISGNRITLGIEAPSSVRVIRAELQTMTESDDLYSEKTTVQPVAIRAPINLDFGADSCGGCVPRTAK